MDLQILYCPAEKDERESMYSSVSLSELFSLQWGLCCRCGWGGGRGILPTLPRKSHRCPGHSMARGGASIHMSKAVITWLGHFVTRIQLISLSSPALWDKNWLNKHFKYGIFAYTNHNVQLVAWLNMKTFRNSLKYFPLPKYKLVSFREDNRESL